MHEITYTTDWFAGTSLGRPLVHLSFPYRMGEINWSAQEKPKLGYNRAARMNCGAVVYNHSQYTDMGYHVVLSGDVLRNLRDAGMTDKQIAHSLRYDMVRASRVDIAMDIIGNHKHGVELFAGAIRRNELVCVSQNVTLTEGVGKYRTGGTLYIGSRTSERMLRVYDKAAESGIEGVNWTRIEFELKGEQAASAHNLLAVNESVADVFRAFWKSFVRRCDNSTITWLIGSTTATIPELPRKTPTTLAWLMDQVIPAMVRYAKDNPETDVIGIVNQLFADKMGEKDAD